MPSAINVSTEFCRWRNAALFSVTSMSLPGRASPMVAIRYSSGVFVAKRTYANPCARSTSTVDGWSVAARCISSSSFSKYRAHTASSSASLSVKCR